MPGEEIKNTETLSRHQITTKTAHLPAPEDQEADAEISGKSCGLECVCTCVCTHVPVSAGDRGGYTPPPRPLRGWHVSRPPLPRSPELALIRRGPAHPVHPTRAPAGCTLPLRIPPWLPPAPTTGRRLAGGWGGVLWGPESPLPKCF